MGTLLKKYYWLWVTLGGVALGFLLFLIFGLALFTLKPAPPEASSNATPYVTVIPPPTLTPAIVVPTQTQPTVTPTSSIPTGGIAVGDYVQISGTNGVGLRLRSQAGTQSPMVFLGMDDEVFLVKDGPKEANGFVWWFLQAPYDSKRSGWAASDFLKVIQKSSN